MPLENVFDNNLFFSKAIFIEINLLGFVQLAKTVNTGQKL